MEKNRWLCKTVEDTGFLGVKKLVLEEYKHQQAHDTQISKSTFRHHH